MFAILKLKMTILERGVQFLCPWLWSSLSIELRQCIYLC
jgi:hypothetical protein